MGFNWFAVVGDLGVLGIYFECCFDLREWFDCGYVMDLLLGWCVVGYYGIVLVYYLIFVFFLFITLNCLRLGLVCVFLGVFPGCFEVITFQVFFVVVFGCFSGVNFR